jgi:hypothetical protein
MNPDRLDPRQESPALAVLAAVESGHVDLKAAVLFLASRLSEAERRLVHLGRSIDRMRRRTSDVESRLAGLARESSRHEESLRMICAVLKDLDDPYGFGMSLDERLAYDEADRTTEEEG